MLSKRKVYFLGGGGIGMSALMRYFLAQGKRVGAYDKTATHLTEALLKEGAQINFVDEIEAIPDDFIDADNTLVVYTPAIPADSKQFSYFKNGGFALHKRSEVLGFITRATKNIAVAGTHGKTTISSMIAHCLKHCEFPFTAFLGGVSKNLGSNYYHDVNSEVTVIEADEYDRSFLRLTPDIITVSAVDPDHLDIYGTEKEMQGTFRKFIAENLKPGGISIIEKKLETILGKQQFSYSLNDNSADYFMQNLMVKGREFSADIVTPNQTVQQVSLGIPGLHNMENALVCTAVLDQLGIALEKIKFALQAYQGVDRRFDVHIERSNCVYIDDYAHHPEEIRNLVLSVKEMYPTKRIAGIFQPHLFTRTRDFLDGFAEALSLLDEVCLLEIYPARELPIEGINSSLLLSKIQKNSKTLCSKKDLPHYISNMDCEVVLTIGAGDIGMEVENVKQSLLQKANTGG